MQKEYLIRGALTILLASILLGMSARGTNRSAIGSTAARPHPGSGFVQKDNVIIVVSLGKDGQSNAVATQQAQHLAQLAVQKL